MKERGIDLTGHVSRWIGDVELKQFRWIVCVGHDEAAEVRTLLGSLSASIIVANEDHGGIPDPYELGLSGYQSCVSLLDQVMPQVALQIRSGSQTGASVL
jgi:protein-tyrosine-phosphatase